MPTKESRKESIRQYKERKPLVGIYAVRCATNGHTWVGSSKNLEATRNGCWFSLRNGTHREKSLQEEWNACGEPAFSYEIMGKMDEDTPSLIVEDWLKKEKLEWVQRCGAQPLL